jgi:hypothetical protein
MNWAEVQGDWKQVAGRAQNNEKERAIVFDQ